MASDALCHQPIFARNPTILSHNTLTGKQLHNLGYKPKDNQAARLQAHTEPKSHEDTPRIQLSKNRLQDSRKKYRMFRKKSERPT